MTIAATSPLPPTFNSTQVDLTPDGATVMLASLYLGAGSWIVFGKYQVLCDGSVAANTTCQLISALNFSGGDATPTASSGSPIDMSDFTVTALAGQSPSLNVSLMGSVVQTTGGFAIITGKSLSLPAPMAMAIQLVAIKIDTLEA